MDMLVLTQWCGEAGAGAAGASSDSLSACVADCNWLAEPHTDVKAEAEDENKLDVESLPALEPMARSKLRFIKVFILSRCVLLAGKDFKKRSTILPTLSSFLALEYLLKRSV